MSDESIKAFVDRHGNALIVAVTILIVAAVALWYMDRQQTRNMEMQRLEQQDIYEEWGPPRQNPRPRNAQDNRGKVL